MEEFESKVYLCYLNIWVYIFAVVPQGSIPIKSRLDSGGFHFMREGVRGPKPTHFWFLGNNESLWNLYCKNMLHTIQGCVDCVKGYFGTDILEILGKILK